jgi:DNA topoisomerase-2
MNDSNRTVTITELPVGVWTKDYKTFLDEMASVERVKEGERVPKTLEYAYTEDGKPLLKHFDDLYTDDEVKFILYFDEDTYEDLKAHPSDIVRRFRLTSTWRTTNMTAFDPAMKITKYTRVGQILESFFVPRLNAYEERRQREMERLEAEAVEADAKARFLRAVLEGTLDLRKATDEEIVAAMEEHELPALSGEGTGVEGYEYLLRLRMDRVKAKAIEEAELAVANALEAVESLRSTTAAQLWLKDLEEFESAWKKMITVRASALANAPVQTKQKKAVKKST